MRNDERIVESTSKLRYQCQRKVYIYICCLLRTKVFCLSNDLNYIGTDIWWKKNNSLSLKRSAIAVEFQFDIFRLIWKFMVRFFNEYNESAEEDETKKMQQK